MHHEPLPDLWQAGDVENCQPAVANLSRNCVCRDKRNPEARHYCLLDRLIGSYLHADAGLDAMLGQEPLRQQARPGANLAHQNVCLAISRGEIERCLARG